MVNDACPKGVFIGFCVVYACPDGCEEKKRCIDNQGTCPLECESFPPEGGKCPEAGKSPGGSS